MSSDVITEIISHHTQLEASLTALVEAVLASARTNGSWEEPVARLRRFLSHDIVAHARAEEDVLYAAAASESLRPLVTGMIFEHQTLLNLTHQLDDVTTAVDAAAVGSAIRAVFTGHVRRENDLLLPAIAADPHTDLRSLLPVMQQRFAHHQALTA